MEFEAKPHEKVFKEGDACGKEQIEDLRPHRRGPKDHTTVLFLKINTTIP